MKKVPLPSYDKKSRSRDDVAFSEFCRVTNAVAQHMATVIDHCIAEIASPYFAVKPVELEVPEAAIFRG